MDNYMVKKFFVCVLMSCFTAVAFASPQQDTVDNVSDDIVLSELDADEDVGYGGQAVSSLFLNSQDVFDRNIGYALSPFFFKTRGYDNNDNSVYINGVIMNDAETGRSSFSEWGGLNDATRNKEIISGLFPTDFSFGNVGGAQNINMRASAIPKQHKFSYALSNRTYVHRLMYTFGTGVMKNGWSVAASISRRWGNGGYIAGSIYDYWGYYLGVEKRFAKHSLNLTAFGSPGQRGMNAAATQEAYDLVGSNFYNPNWGYQTQDGKKVVRNARIRHTFIPTFLLTWDYKPNNDLKLSTTASYQFGEYGSTALNWYDAPDPRPDYYRYMPSYQTLQSAKDFIADMWRNDVNKRQIDWDELYQVNYTQNKLGEQAKYIIEDRRNDVSDIALSSVLNYKISNPLKLTAGLKSRHSTSHNYTMIEDMLGGLWWKDVDQFSERDFNVDADEVQNDLNNPNRIVKEGDIYKYNYKLNVSYNEIFANFNFVYPHIDFYAGLDLSTTTFWREGLMRNGRAPDNSYGTGKTHSFFNYGLKAGVVGKINGFNYIYVNAMFKTRAPWVRYSYVSPRIKDNTVADLRSEQILSGDINYLFRSRYVSFRATFFATQYTDAMESMSFYHDEYRTFVNYNLTGVNKRHLGVEFGIEVKATPWLSLIFVGSYGDYRYTARPQATISVENGLREDMTTTVYEKNFFISGPQNGESFQLKFSLPYSIWIDASVNYVGKTYLSFNPERRTELSVNGLLPEDPLVAKIFDQEEVKGGFTLDASIGKGFRFKGKYYLNINASVSNILNNKNIVSGGYEQSRMDFAEHNLDKFPSKYYYSFGTTFFINLGFRF
ncbi:MAG: outer membrane beta-barrel family protein [Bacteroidales bacterium]|jgi:hypothetical protein|nr:outer membrane beta-barrel family protein [Bacteroidales bacterium]